eukprot:4001958-Amphidinium_carterae.1
MSKQPWYHGSMVHVVNSAGPLLSVCGPRGHVRGHSAHTTPCMDSAWFRSTCCRPAAVIWHNNASAHLHLFISSLTKEWHGFSH